jgi:hypothetical protein
LHKTTAHFVFIPMSGKIFSAFMSATTASYILPFT